MNKALVIVDMQNDFMPWGTLPVAEGDKIISLINQLQLHFDLVVATQDWHPANHASFAINHTNKKPGEQIELNGLPQTLWPSHCVQNTQGAKLVSNLETSHVNKIFHKGTDPDIDSYSGFFDNGHRKSTGLGEYLTQAHTKEIYLAGVATEYCVKYSALDAISLGFKTYVIADACQGVNLHINDVDEALFEMQQAGVIIIQSQMLMRPVKEN